MICPSCGHDVDVEQLVPCGVVLKQPTIAGGVECKGSDGLAVTHDAESSCEVCAGSPPEAGAEVLLAEALRVIIAEAKEAEFQILFHKLFGDETPHMNGMTALRKAIVSAEAALAARRGR